MRNKRSQDGQTHLIQLAETRRVKTLDGVVVASATYPSRTDADDQTENLNVNLPAGAYMVETSGVVNGRATSPLGHYGRFYLKTFPQ